MLTRSHMKVTLSFTGKVTFTSHSVLRTNLVLRDLLFPSFLCNVAWKCTQIFEVDWLIYWLTLDSSPYCPDAPRPFVPHNLISTQESPVHLPKFQMAPRLKILMSSGSEKGTQIYFFFSLKKSRQMNPLQVAQQGPYGERYTFTGHFCISLETSIKILLNKNFFSSSQRP